MNVLFKIIIYKSITASIEQPGYFLQHIHQGWTGIKSKSNSSSLRYERPRECILDAQLDGRLARSGQSSAQVEVWMMISLGNPKWVFTTTSLMQSPWPAALDALPPTWMLQMVICLGPGGPTRWFPEEPCRSGMVGGSLRPCQHEGFPGKSSGALQKSLLGAPTLLSSRRNYRRDQK